MVFNNLVGLYALIALVPFILIYLIKPKSFERVIPSLMFIMQEKRKFKKASFLQKLISNLLFFMQLLIILFLAFSVAAPFLEIPHKVLVRNNIIVLDASASMNTQDGITTRFAKAANQAKDHLGMRNTIILAESSPVIILEDGRSGEALDMLNKLTPKATGTNLGDAVLLANDLLDGKKGVVTVLSDFIITGGSDLLMAKRSLTSKGNTVNFVDVKNGAENIGIVGMVVDKDETTVEIKNYMDEEVKVKAVLTQNNKKLSQKSLELLPNSKEKIIFETLSGISKITLDVNDDLTIDNVAYISSPEKMAVDVLLITNNVDGNKIKAALNALGVDLEIREPPTVNAYNIDHDIVFVNDINNDLFVPTDFVDIRKYVEKGGILVITAQDNLDVLPIADLLPLDIGGIADKATSVCSDIVGIIFPRDPFSDDPCFTSASNYIMGTAKNNTITLASSQLDSSPMLTQMKKDNGQVIYYGLMDKYSSFYSDTFYPLFWNNMINYLMKTEDINDYNHKGGRMLVIKEQEVETPFAKVTTNKLFLDEAGIYKFDKREVAVNLLNEKESDINAENIELEDEIGKFSVEKVKDVEDLDLEVPLLIAALVLLIIEFIYIKFRGDL